MSRSANILLFVITVVVFSQNISVGGFARLGDFKTGNISEHSLDYLIRPGSSDPYSGIKGMEVEKMPWMYSMTTNTSPTSFESIDFVVDFRKSSSFVNTLDLPVNKWITGSSNYRF